MIDLALNYLRDELNDYLADRHEGQRELTVLGTPGGHADSNQSDLNNKLVLTLLTLQRDATAQHSARSAGQGTSLMSGASPLNLMPVFVVSAHFPNRYSEGLSALSTAIEFFQNRPVHTRNQSPTLPAQLGSRLTVEWFDLDMQSVLGLWAALGGHHRPFAAYRLRWLTFDGDATGHDVPDISHITPAS